MLPYGEDPTGQPMAWAGWIIAVTLGIRGLWRRLSRDRVEIATDRAEQDILRTALSEAREMRQRADRATSELHNAIRAAAECMREVELLRERVQQLTVELREARASLDRSNRRRDNHE